MMGVTHSEGKPTKTNLSEGGDDQLGWGRCIGGAEIRRSSRVTTPCWAQSGLVVRTIQKYAYMYQADERSADTCRTPSRARWHPKVSAWLDSLGLAGSQQQAVCRVTRTRTLHSCGIWDQNGHPAVLSIRLRLFEVHFIGQNQESKGSATFLGLCVSAVS